MKKQKTQNKNTGSINDIINDSLINLKKIIDANTVIGEEIKTSDGTIIIPISKIVVGFVAGGGEFEAASAKQNLPFAGGSGAGFTVVPIGFLAGKKGQFSFVNTKNEVKYDDLINLTNKTLKLIINNFNAKQNKEKK